MAKKTHILRPNSRLPFCGNLQGTVENTISMDDAIHGDVNMETICKTCQQNIEKETPVTDNNNEETTMIETAMAEIRETLADKRSPEDTILIGALGFNKELMGKPVTSLRKHTTWKGFMINNAAKLDTVAWLAVKVNGGTAVILRRDPATTLGWVQV